jgi:hypothetical protein
MQNDLLIVGPFSYAVADEILAGPLRNEILEQYHCSQPTPCLFILPYEANMNGQVYHSSQF